MGGATPAVCEPRPSFCSVRASSFPDGFSPCVAWNFLMASTVDSSHLPFGVPANDPSFPSACWISETRSGVGAVCPFSLRPRRARVFFDEACDLLLVEDSEDLDVVPRAAAVPNRPNPAATSSARVTGIALRRGIRLGPPSCIGTIVRDVLTVCRPPARHPTGTRSRYARCRHAGEP